MIIEYDNIVYRRKIIAVSRRKINAVSRRKIVAVSRWKIIVVSRRKIIGDLLETSGGGGSKMSYYFLNIANQLRITKSIIIYIDPIDRLHCPPGQQAP